ncbi:MAG: hypothetical protein FD146_295 [Anaerolineaceae bacterium]|nr:MAG: hypothetical protein FD146_295 [Anaerolineaceae bacterium]
MQLIAFILMGVVGAVYLLGWWITFTVVFFREDRRSGRRWWIVFADIFQALMFVIIPIASLANAFDKNVAVMERKACQIHLLTVLGGAFLLTLIWFILLR